MQFDNSSVSQAKKVQLFDRFCQSLHSFIGNLSCFSDFFCFRSCAFITHYIYYAASKPDARKHLRQLFSGCKVNAIPLFAGQHDVIRPADILNPLQAGTPYNCLNACRMAQDPSGCDRIR